MSMPFYVSPEQLMKDRADFARKGIGRGRSVVVVQYADGIVFVGENASRALHKVSEIYDRIAFAAVGRYNEFENLRIAGVRLADMRGYAYDRRDVTGRGLANAYAQTLGTIFSSGGEKPYEVEIFVAEVGEVVEDDQIYRLTYDGQIVDEHGFAVMGGSADTVTGHLKEHYTADMSLRDAVRAAVEGLEHSESSPRVVSPEDLEVAVLDRSRSQQRKFKRISAELLVSILGDRRPSPAAEDGAGDQADGSTDSAAPQPEDADASPPIAPPVAPPVAPGPPTPHQPTDPASPPDDPGGPHPPVDPGDPLS
ncbi:MAG: Proteasome subunit alpha, bacterial [uncultured Nocardioidaceae bacterium]|uniref:Proteasome subunit alpha n=1 Tax=uncultured Nocardioidaceae bacterium TaxID=253824 RepID=A0A6J4MQA3_9ACTN|nr:MAG: Proteasome subunit alpha, bacterial [uncultured Nocardioidaceae bacterium]